MVLVSNPYRFIYLKTRKSASTSAEMALEPFCAPPGHKVVETVKTLITEYGIIGSRMLPCIPPAQPCAVKGKWCNHKSAKDVLHDLGQERFNAFIKITTVRNPFDRCVSAYHWHSKDMISEETSFESICQGFQEYLKSRDWHTDEENVLVDGQYIIDRTIRFEHLAGDLSAIATDLGITIDPAHLPHTKSTANTRKQYNIADYYDQTCIEIVRERMSWVFEYNNYPDHPLAA